MIRYYIIEGLQNNRDIHEWATEPPGGVSAWTKPLQAIKTTDKGLLRLHNNDVNIHNRIVTDAKGVPITPLFNNETEEETWLNARFTNISLALRTAINNKLSELGISITGTTMNDRIKDLLKAKDSWK